MAPYCPSERPPYRSHRRGEGDRTVPVPGWQRRANVPAGTSPSHTHRPRPAGTTRQRCPQVGRSGTPARLAVKAALETDGGYARMSGPVLPVTSVLDIDGGPRSTSISAPVLAKGEINR